MSVNCSNYHVICACVCVRFQAPWNGKAAYELTLLNRFFIMLYSPGRTASACRLFNDVHFTVCRRTCCLVFVKKVLCRMNWRGLGRSSRGTEENLRVVVAGTKTGNLPYTSQFRYRLSWPVCRYHLTCFLGYVLCFIFFSCIYCDAINGTTQPAHVFQIQVHVFARVSVRPRVRSCTSRTLT
jgi:hypothetical protein